MVSQRLFDKLNDQMNFEFYSSHIYLAMSAYFESIDLPGFANFFRVQAEEEKFHAMKFYTYINEMEGRITFKGIPDVENEYSSALDALKAALEHEKKVTKRIYELMDIALEEREHATMSLLKWFIDEQVEEEATVNSLIKKLERIGNDVSALYTLDEQLSTRVFTPPTNA
ncbi:ferritin [Caloramator sp. mosi_1]|uniref:ferritin n=1 Tax=Caloramator sp. mosi_1 TaxID=3023090 RepID=UPI002360DA02|nr:ferritin [Caloramator sp. mosi_1]WDC84124.1 ferritin [Caloramator sp. mosi_1]